MTASIRIHLADDHPVFRSGLRELLAKEDDLRVIGESSNAADALAKVRELAPDVLVLDIHMPGLPAAELVREVVQAELPTRVLVLTMHNEERYLREFLKVGARGFVVKSSPGAQVVAAIRKVNAGEEYVDPQLAHFLISSYIGRTSENPHTVEVLTAREREVCVYLASGHTNAEVASELGISRRTVETHRSAIMAKLDLKSRAELVQFAIETGVWSGPKGQRPAH